MFSNITERVLRLRFTTIYEHEQKLKTRYKMKKFNLPEIQFTLPVNYYNLRDGRNISEQYLSKI
jgi:hypothetical protein